MEYVRKQLHELYDEYRTLSINDTIGFLQVCTHGGIRKAAEKMYITPQGLSRQILHIEHILGTQLFTRSHRGFHLTEAGRIFERYAQNAVESTVAMHSDMAQLLQQQSGVIHLAFSSVISGSSIMEYVENFAAEFPHYKLDWIKADDVDTHALMKSEPAFIGLTVAPLHCDDYQSIVLQRQPYVLLAAEGHPLAKRRKMSAGLLRGERLILLHEGHMAHQNVLADCRAAGFEPDVAYSASGAASAAMLCKQGKGVLVLVQHLAEMLDQTDMVCLPFDSSLHSWDIALMAAKSHPYTDAEQFFIDYICQRCAEAQPKGA